MGLKETLEQNQTQNTAPQKDSEKRRLSQDVEVYAKSASTSTPTIQTASLSQEDIQNPNNWSQEPESQMRRFEFAASIFTGNDSCRISSRFSKSQ